MESIKRKIRLFLISYGRLFAFIIGVIFIVIFIIQTLNNIVIQKNENKYSSEAYIEEQKKKEEQEEDKKYISLFIDYCNEGRIEEAYNMLSNNCKNEKYSTIEEFEKQYINKIFNIKICKYEIRKKENIYVITLTQDMIATGKSNSNIEQRYRMDGVLEDKIYLCD